MGIFFNRKKKAKEVEISKEGLISALAHEMVTQTLGPEPSPERIAEMEERERLAEEGRRIRKEKIAANGVDVAMFDDNRIAKDALCFLDEFAPSYKGLALDMSKARISGNFQNLTKTGKLPKNVFEGNFSVDGYDYDNHTKSTDDSVTVHLKYLASGAVNMVDLHLWHDFVRYGMSIRTVGNSYQITCITSTDMRRDLQDTLYLDNKPEDSTGAKAIFDEAMRKLLA